MSIDHLHPETLGAMVDGELSPQDATAAQAHLNGCLPCSNAALALMQLQSATKRTAFCHAPSPEVLEACTRVGHARSSAVQVWRRGRSRLLLLLLGHRGS